MKTKTALCLALLTAALALPAPSALAEVPQDAPLLASASQNSSVIVNMSPFYRTKYDECLGIWTNANPTDTSGATESARVHAQEAMPSEMVYARDGGGWSKPIGIIDNHFTIHDQPSGIHGYTLRFTFANGRGIYYGYTYFKPTLNAGQATEMVVSKSDADHWKWNKKVTFKIDQRLRELNPNLVTGKATAEIDGEKYPVDKNGCFTVTLPFEPAQNLEITVRAPKAGLDFYLRDFELTPQSPATIVLRGKDVGD